MFVIYESYPNSENTRVISSHKSLRGAKISFTALQKRLEKEKETRYYRPREVHLTSHEDYESNVVKMVTRINMMSGLEYQERADTPNFCSPASESYWSS